LLKFPLHVSSLFFIQTFPLCIIASQFLKSFVTFF
jgi:hypothetical protein